jgi:hypothetical protein
MLPSRQLGQLCRTYNQSQLPSNPLQVLAILAAAAIDILSLSTSVYSYRSVAYRYGDCRWYIAKSTMQSEYAIQDVPERQR